MTKNLKTLLLLIAISLLTLTSCGYKDLCFHHDHTRTVRIEFDWRYAPESTRPLMQVWLYSEDFPDQKPIFFNISGTHGGEISVAEGRYTLIAHPAEMEANRINSASKADLHLLNTRSASSSEILFGASSAPKNLILEPETTWVAAARNVNIMSADIDYECVTFSDEMIENFTPMASSEQTITLYPSDPMSYYTLEVRNVDLNLQPSAVVGALDGLSSGLYAADGTSHPSAAAIAFECSYDADAHTFCSEFITFGRHSEAATPHWLSLYLLTRDNRLYRLSSTSDSKFDLSSQVKAATDPHHVHLIVDGVKLEAEQQTDDSGEQFGASASEYREVNQEITI